MTEFPRVNGMCVTKLSDTFLLTELNCISHIANGMENIIYHFGEEYCIFVGGGEF